MQNEKKLLYGVSVTGVGYGAIVLALKMGKFNNQIDR